MATKEQNLKRLDELSRILGREPDISGSAAEIAQRVAELEEELDDTDDTAGQDIPLSPENALTGHENELVSAHPETVIDTAALVKVVALVTLHIDAFHATRDEPVAFVLPGTAFRISASVADAMTERGLAKMQ
ncbi:DNA-packaging protein FI [Escherichia coli]|uniref:DNA-packaging protein FI n=1 Tax=Escherichia coli TaxID=562 RepID=UPI000D15BA85|nr:DNA-packaging protein FI [Escherichia coli]EGF1626180.1 DNA-packaging protein FI [Escherichia coli]EGK4048024.1 DNA-packaging protein FI [Escherichia coli]EGK4057678.1 DNA-packaging protein FI [Escherichia coli]PSY69687.1 DNA-packaging protein FI [Escherichia coli]PSZ11058.1 DNA-packaging protein FI [Escherichia coli]